MYYIYVLYIYIRICIYIYIISICLCLRLYLYQYLHLQCSNDLVLSAGWIYFCWGSNEKLGRPRAISFVAWFVPVGGEQSLCIGRFLSSKEDQAQIGQVRTVVLCYPLLDGEIVKMSRWEVRLEILSGQLIFNDDVVTTGVLESLLFRYTLMSTLSYHLANFSTFWEKDGNQHINSERFQSVSWSYKWQSHRNSSPKSGLAPHLFLFFCPWKVPLFKRYNMRCKVAQCPTNVVRSKI